MERIRGKLKMNDKKWAKEYDKKLKRIRIAQDLGCILTVLILLILIWKIS